MFEFGKMRQIVLFLFRRAKTSAEDACKIVAGVKNDFPEGQQKSEIRI